MCEIFIRRYVKQFELNAMVKMQVALLCFKLIYIIEGELSAHERNQDKTINRMEDIFHCNRDDSNSGFTARTDILLVLSQ